MIPPNFFKVVKDFISDLIGTFPELKENPVVASIYNDDGEESYQTMFDTIIAVFPKHVMNIMHENEIMFESECILFPGVDFKNLWNENITEKTKNIIWKYLKLILFIVLGHLNMDENFTNLLQGMDLNKSVEDIKKAFESDKPNLDGFMDGKLGSLAKEIAEETIGDVGDADILQDMMKDPSKMFSLMSSVGDKLDKRIKSGELKESELISEASDLFSKMKDMPAMKQFEGMFKNMNMGATQAKMNENLKRAKMKERLREKLNARKEKEPVVAEVKPTKKKKNKKNIHDVLDS
jgi:hypothetical protein